MNKLTADTHSECLGESEVFVIIINLISICLSVYACLFIWLYR